MKIVSLVIYCQNDTYWHRIIENKSDVELIAIGIGHDVSRYYTNAVTIMDVDELGEVLLNKLSNIFTSDNKKIIAA